MGYERLAIPTVDAAADAAEQLAAAGDRDSDHLMRHFKIDQAFGIFADLESAPVHLADPATEGG